MKPITRSLQLSLLAALLFINSLPAYASLNANFTYQQSCNGEIVFTASDQTYSGYTWTFGDNANGAGISVTHQYAPGIYSATLTVQNGANTNSSSQQIFISEYITQQITGPADVCTGSTTTYSLSNASPNFQYNWLLSGADIRSDNHGSSVQVDFDDVGTAVLSVIISNGAGCDSILVQSIQVHETPRLTLPGQSNDSSQVGLVICQNTPVWYHVLSTNGTNGNISWSSGNGTIHSPQGTDSMLFVFPNAGSTYLQIVEETPAGCTDTIFAIVNVTESPSITASGTNACLSSDNYFTSTLSAGNNSLTYVWSFDDGTDATGNNSSHIFPTTGQHSAQVIVTNGNGCRDTADAVVQVDAFPGPQIECVGPVCTDDVEVYSTSTVAGANYHWAVTGGIITSGGGLGDNTIGVTWGGSSMGTIELYLTGPGIYCQFPTIEYVQIIGGALAIQGDVTPCLYSTETYTTDIIPGGVYNWTVTGGFIQRGQGTHQVQVYFNSLTPSNISVNITHQILSCNSSALLTVTPLQQFNVYGSSTACAGVSASFTTYEVGNFNWTVESGILQSGNGTNSILAYWNVPGFYRVEATIVTGFCNTQAETFVTVVERKHETIEGKNLVCVGTNEVYNVSPDNSSYTWSVASGGTIVGGASANSVSISWNSAGAHTIRAIYRDGNYCPDTSYYSVTVAPESVPDVTGDTVTCYGNVETYSFVPVAGVNYVWETEGGIITTGQNTANVSVMWIGNQIGLLRLRNSVCNTFIQKNIVIRPTPEVHIKLENITCDGSSVDLRVIEDYPSYNWSNGSSTQTISINTVGIYNVTVADVLGCTASGTQNANPIPSNAFISSSIVITYPIVPIPYAYAELTAVGNPTPVSYLWSTGNKEMTQYVSQAGTYTVTITNEFGCTAEMSATATTVIITGGGGGICTHLPCPGISPVFTTNNPVCNPVQFTPGVVANYYFWNFSDGVFSNLSNPTHRFTSPGIKTIEFSYSNDGTTWYDCSQNLVITSVIDVSFENAGGCKGGVVLTNTSVSALPLTSVLWDLGDGNTSTADPVLNYQYPNNASSYLVKLTLSDGTCTDFLQKQISVHQLSADFVYSGICKDNPALFNSTTIHTKLISSYTWSFGNGETADYYNPVTYYDAVGNYNVTLNIKDEDGCLDMATHTVTVNQFVPMPLIASGPLTFCKGSSVDLSVPAGYTSYWNTAETTSSIHVTQSGDYYAWLTDNATGCSGFSETSTVVVNRPPRAYINNYYGESEICEGNYIYLRAIPNSGVTFQWYHDGTALTTGYYYSAMATPALSGNYQLVITDANGCKDTSSILHLLVHPTPATPVIIEFPFGNHCDGDEVTLGVVGSDLYQWNNGTTGNITHVYHSGSVQVIATNSFGCSSSAYDYISFDPMPDFRYFLKGCYQICKNDNVTVSGPAGMQSYLWSNGATTQSITLSASGEYSLSATTTQGCSDASGSFKVDVFDADNIQLGSDTFICLGQTLVLDAGVYPSVTWQDNSHNRTYTVTDTGLYFVEVTNPAGCVSSDTIHVGSFSDYINLGNDTAICLGQTVILDAGVFPSILWQDGSTNQTFTVTDTGLYFVQVTNSIGCISHDTIHVGSFTDYINLGNDTSICAGQTIVLDAGFFPAILWQDNSTNQTFTVTDTGLYFVQVTNSAGCTSSDSIHVSQFTNAINLGNDTVICAGQTVVLDAGAFPSVLWQDGSTNQTYTVTDSGLYIVQVTSSAGCVAKDSIHVAYVFASVDLGNDAALCAGATLQLSASGNFASYLWQDNSTGPVYTVSVAGSYSVTATTAEGCTAADGIAVSYFPDISVVLSGDNYLCDTILLSVDDIYAGYLWSTGETATSILVTEVGVYAITVTDANGCTGSDTIPVFDCNNQRPSECQNQYALPNAFTPNGDGTNDEFRVLRNNGTPKSKFLSFKVFNRWGEMMFETNNENTGWDGKFKGREVPMGVSTYTFQYVCDNQSIMHSGTVTLIR